MESLESLSDCLVVVVSASLATTLDTLDAGILGAVEEEDILGLADIGLEVGALVNLSGEAINKVVLIVNAKLTLSSNSDLNCNAQIVAAYNLKFS